MDDAVVNLEDSSSKKADCDNGYNVKRTDQYLDMMVCKIDTVEKQIAEPDISPESSVLRLLESVSEVRNDYQNLRREISEVQELQKQVNDRLKEQIQLVQGNFMTLKQRIAAASLE